ncbi:MAG: PTS sugar transporter subunit IIA [Treponema sp.]|jgi:PTS system nitrogen regulatory IIA component|nr:PTS sugar transporter subunit IIA [Treponema sp.]
MKKENETEPDLAGLVERGGILYDVKGTTPQEVLTAIIGALPSLICADRNGLLKAVLEREELMSTGISGGIALPHPRNPMAGENEQFVTIAFPSSPVDWKALDGGKVTSVLLIVSSSAKLHLHTLSMINFLCRQEKFTALLRSRAPAEEIIAAVREAERNWK